MRGTRCADVSIETFATTESLPPDALLLLDEAASMFDRRPWWDVVLSTAMPAGTSAVLVLCRVAGRPVGLFAMQRHGPSLQSLTTPYTCRYTPLLAADLDRATRIAVLTAVAAFCRPGGVTRLDALPAEWEALPDLLTGARKAGLRTLRFNHFGNWHEDVTGLDWSGYLARRPGALRETIRRRLKRAEKLDGARFTLWTQPADMDAAAAVFEAVYARSWKDAEPYPHFNVTLLRAMAALGSLRLAVWSIHEVPVAVQFWVVECGCATVLKLAHDEAFKAHSPGTVLTALVLRHLLDQEAIAELDFGRGDDVYKQGWVSQRRQRIGLMLINPWRPSGAFALARHAVGRIRAAVRPGGQSDHTGANG